MNVTISLSNMNAEDLQKLRLVVVKYYLTQEKSLRKTAQHFGIHHNTVNQWVKWYKKGGEENLLRTRTKQRPWNRSSFAIEEKVIFLKEEEPSLTITQVQNKLEEKGIELSRKCIFNILKRYGLAGSQKNRHTPFLSFDKSLYIRKDKTEPPPAKIIDYFKLRNRIDTFNPQIDKINYSEIYQSFKSLRIQFEKKKLFYSALRAGMIEIIALQWLGQSKRLLSLINRFLKRVSQRGQPVIRIRLLIHKGTALANLLDFNGGLTCAKMVERTLRRIRFFNTF
ncbi:helix-turn-helix domain-containing protein, partial [candidate division WOR-3 bacterium]|nr:helix-turn-helix domain-containing protein [candidate division WOR-3 bacterium]